MHEGDGWLKVLRCLSAYLYPELSVMQDVVGDHGKDKSRKMHHPDALWEGHCACSVAEM